MSSITEEQGVRAYAEYLDTYTRGDNTRVDSGPSAIESLFAVRGRAARALAVADMRASREPRTMAHLVREVATMMSTEGVDAELPQATADVAAGAPDLFKGERKAWTHEMTSVCAVTGTPWVQAGDIWRMKPEFGSESAMVLAFDPMSGAHGSWCIAGAGGALGLISSDALCTVWQPESRLVEPMPDGYAYAYSLAQRRGYPHPCLVAGVAATAITRVVASETRAVVTCAVAEVVLYLAMAGMLRDCPAAPEQQAAAS